MNPAGFDRYRTRVMNFKLMGYFFTFGSENSHEGSAHVWTRFLQYAVYRLCDRSP